MFNPIEYVRQKIKEYNSFIDTRPSSAMYDLVVMPISAMANKLMLNFFYLYNTRYIENYNIMPDEEFDLLMGNLLIYRREGSKASGIARFYYSNPTAITIAKTSFVQASDSVRFIVMEDTSVTVGEMSLNVEYGLYYIDVPVEAEAHGEKYNIMVDEITSSVMSGQGYVSVRNPYPITGGVERETNEQLYMRAKSAVSQRNLLTDRSIDTTLMSEFSYVENLDTIGFGDPEMKRDLQDVLVNGNIYSMHMGGCADIYVDTGSLSNSVIDIKSSESVPISKAKASGLTGAFISNNTFVDSSADFITASIQEGDIVKVYNIIGLSEFTVSSIDGAGQITTVEDASGLDNDLSYRVYSVRVVDSPLVYISSVEKLTGGTFDGIYYSGGTPVGENLNDGRGFAVEPAEISTDVDGFSLSNYGDTQFMTEEHEGNISIRFLPQDFTQDSSTVVSVSTTGTAYNARCCAINAFAAAITWSDQGSIMLAVVDFISETVVNNATVKTNDATSEYVGNAVAVLDDHIIVNTLEYTLATSSYKAFFIKYDPIRDGSSSPAFDEPVIDWAIGSSIQGSPLDIVSHGSNDRVLTASVDDNNLVSVMACYADGFLAGPSASILNGSSQVTSLNASCSPSNSSLVSWLLDGNTIKMFYAEESLWNTGRYNSITVPEDTRDHSSFVDKSSRIHVSYINENKNSGDIIYLKLDNDFSAMVSEEIIEDQYNNSTSISMVVDLSRRPIILWNSFDLRSKSIVGCKKNNNDYRLVVGDENFRFSREEVLSLRVDPVFDDIPIRINYTYPSKMELIADYVSSRESVDRVVVANYLVKNHIPCIIDVDIEYSGDDEIAKESILDYINSIQGSDVYVSGILSSITLSDGNVATMPMVLTSTTYTQDGRLIVEKSSNGFSYGRTVRFIAGNINVI